MRLSAEDLHGEDYEKAKLCQRAIIELNGVNCGSGVLVADEEQGYIDRCCINDNGEYVLTADGGEIVIERIHGIVKIIDPQAQELEK